MSATPVSKRELVRLLVVEHGQKKAAELSGEPYEKVRKWTQRGNWLASQSVPKAIETTVNRVVEDLAEHERETRLSLAKASRRMAKDCEELPVRHAKLAHTVAQTMAIVHRQGEGSVGQGFNLNLLNLADLKLTIGGKPVE